MENRKDKTEKDAVKKDAPSTPAPGKKKVVVHRMRPLSQSEANIGPAQRSIRHEMLTIDEEPGRCGTDPPDKRSDRDG